MTSQLKWALIALVAIIILAVMSMKSGDPVEPGGKPAVTSPGR